MALPGMYIGAGMATSVGPFLEYRDHTYVEADDPLIPSNVVSGDLLIAAGIAVGSDNALTPSGWSPVVSVDNAATSVNVVAKISNGTETGNIFLFGGGANSSVILALNGGLSSLGSIVDANVEGTDGDPSAQVVNASTLGNLPFLVFAYYGSGGIITGDSFTGDTADDERGGNRSLLRWKDYNLGSVPQDITVDTDDSGPDNGLASAIIEVNF